MFEITQEQRNEKARQLQAYLNVAGKRTQIVEEVLKTADVNLENGTVNLDKKKLQVINEELVKPKPIKEVFELTRRTSSSGVGLKSTSPDQINALLSKGVKGARSIPQSTQTTTPVVQPLMESEDSESTDRINALLNGEQQSSPTQYYTTENTDGKKYLREEFIREMVADKDVRLEIMEMVVFELLGKDRIKRLLREILTEAKNVKK